MQGKLFFQFFFPILRFTDIFRGLCSFWRVFGPHVSQRIPAFDIDHYFWVAVCLFESAHLLPFTVVVFFFNYSSAVVPRFYLYSLIMKQHQILVTRSSLFPPQRVSHRVLRFLQCPRTSTYRDLAPDRIPTKCRGYTWPSMPAFVLICGALVPSRSSSKFTFSSWWKCWDFTGEMFWSVFFQPHSRTPWYPNFPLNFLILLFCIFRYLVWKKLPSKTKLVP